MDRLPIYTRSLRCHPSEVPKIYYPAANQLKSVSEIYEGDILTVFNRFPRTRWGKDRIHVCWFEILELNETVALVQECKLDPSFKEPTLDRTALALTINPVDLFRRPHVAFFWDGSPTRRRLKLMENVTHKHRNEERRKM